MNEKPATSFLFFLFPALLLLLHHTAIAQQHDKEMQSKKEHIEKSIEYTNFLLNQTKTQKNATLHEFELLELRIENRKALINHHRISQNLLMDTIVRLFLKIDTLENELSGLRATYKNMLQSAYRTHNSYQKALFILASQNINQAWKRLKYYNHYAKVIRLQMEKIHATENLYYSHIAALENKAEKNQMIINDMFDEYARLEDDYAMKNQIIAQLNDQIDQLVANLKRSQLAAKELEKQISIVVEEERDKTTAAGINIIGMSVPSSDANSRLSVRFEENMGRLPWPVGKGVISSTFGEHNHPKLENLKIKNNGINILTHPNAKAKAVFGGVITRIMTVPNFNNVVIIRHGDYLSVYSNLSAIEVQTGTSVDVNQTIGTIFTDETTGKTELHFEIWNGKNQLDPTMWLLDVEQEILTGQKK